MSLPARGARIEIRRCGGAGSDNPGVMNYKNRRLSPPSKNTAYYVDYDLWYQAIPSLAEGKGRFGVTEGTTKTIYVPPGISIRTRRTCRAAFPAQCGRTCRREATSSSSCTFLGSAFPSRCDSFRYLSASLIRLRCRTLSADMSAMPVRANAKHTPCERERLVYSRYPSMRSMSSCLE